MNKKGFFSRWYRLAKGLLALALVALFLFTAMPNQYATGDTLDELEAVAEVEDMEIAPPAEEEIPEPEQGGNPAAEGESTAPQDEEPAEETPAEPDPETPEEETPAEETAGEEPAGEETKVGGAQVPNFPLEGLVPPEGGGLEIITKPGTGDGKDPDFDYENGESVAAAGFHSIGGYVRTGAVMESEWKPRISQWVTLTSDMHGMPYQFTVQSITRTRTSDTRWSLTIVFTYQGWDGVAHSYPLGCTPQLFIGNPGGDPNFPPTATHTGPRYGNTYADGPFTHTFSNLVVGQEYNLSAYINQYPVASFAYMQILGTPDVFGGYTVTYDANGGYGGTKLENQTSPHTLLTAAQAGVSNPGYTFQGWSTTRTGGAIQPGLSMNITANTTLYAIWKSNGHTVTYNAGTGGSGGTTLQNQTSPHTVLTHTAAGVSRSGYAFKGWATTSGGTAQHQPGASLTLTGNITLYAVWEQNTYTVTYSAGTGGSGGTTLQNQTSPHTVLNQTAAGVSRDGYTFKGWATTSGGAAQHQPGASLTLTGNITLYAVWEQNAPSTYTVTYNAGTGGTILANQTSPHTALTHTAAGVSRSGYAFQGWATTSGGTAQHQPGASLTLTGNITLYAVWTQNTYTVTYNAGTGGSGGTTLQNQTSPHTVLTHTAAGVSRNGYIFQGWATTSGGTAQHQPGASLTLTGNITLYAVWTQNTYTVTYNAGTGGSGGTTLQNQTSPHTVLTHTAAGVSRSGYTFKGWATTSGGTAQHQPGASLTLTGNITLYAVWEQDAPTTFTVYYNANGGSGGTTLINQTSPHVVLTQAEALVTRTGAYTFKGWSTWSSATTAQYQPGDSFTLTRDITLYAVWEVSTRNHVVYYQSNGGTGSHRILGTSSPHTLLSLQETGISHPDGLRFVGWSQNANATVQEYNPGQSVVLTSDIVYFYAIWGPSYAYNANTEHGGRGSREVFTELPTTISLILPVQFFGYTHVDGADFLGWSTNKDATQPDPFYAVGSQHTYAALRGVELYAIWDNTAPTYTVTYKTGGTGSGGVTLTNQTSPHTVLTQAEAGVVRSGYTFKGWSTTNGSSIVEYNPGDSLVLTGDITLFGVWERPTYTVIYDPGTRGSGGITLTDRTSPHTVLTQEAAGVSRDGYTFKGWSRSKGASSAAYQPGVSLILVGDTTLYAVWEQNAPDTYTVTYSAGTGGTGGITLADQTSPHIVLTQDAAGVSRSGYTFKGWSISEGATTPQFQAGASIALTIDITIYAVWEANSYNLTIKFEDEDGKTLHTPETVTIYHDGGYTVSDYDIPGYGLEYWQRDGGQKQTTTPPAITGIEGDTTLLLTYSLNDYTVTVVYEDEDAGELKPEIQVSVKHGGSYSPLVPEIEGYTFLHWYTDLDPTERDAAPALVNIQSDVTVTLVYEKSKYAIRIYHLDTKDNLLDERLIEGFDTNPTRHYTNDDSWTIPSVTVHEYAAKYYTMTNSVGADKLPMDTPVDLASGGSDWTLYVYYVSTVVTITYPSRIEFYSNQTDPGNVWSPTYSFGNDSDAALDVYFVKLGASSLVQDGLTLTDNAQNPDEIHLTLNGTANAFAGAALPGTGGFVPNHDYADGLYMGSLAGGDYSGGNTYTDGSFSIGGHYEGLLSTNLKRPRVDFNFHFALADYEP